MNNAPTQRGVLTIGTFDGVHRGHQALIARARERATAIGPDIRVAALVFDPNPIEVLRPREAPARLTSFEQKTDYLKACGADEVHRLEPSSTLLKETPEEFLTIVRREHGLVGVVEGPDFRFGKGRTGDVRTLEMFGAKMGFSVDIVDPVTVTLNDHTVAPARSTMVRWLLQHGRVSDSARVLGRPHTLRGNVVRGDRRGRTIGYPTANIESACMAPADGVYAGRARLPDGRNFIAAISVGSKPTFGECGRAVEAVMLRDSPDPAAEGQVGRDAPAWAPLPGLPEYGWNVDLEFVAWIREQIKFDGIEALLAQMARDCVRIVEVLRVRGREDDQPNRVPAGAGVEAAT
jgi:riboflavin kinase/FMN adenylyltransferase